MRSLEDIMNKLFECNIKSVNNYKEHEYVPTFKEISPNSLKSSLTKLVRLVQSLNRERSITEKEGFRVSKVRML
jgi:hypothetical protein